MATNPTDCTQEYVQETVIQALSLHNKKEGENPNVIRFNFAPVL